MLFKHERERNNTQRVREVKLNPKIWGKFYRYLLFALSVSFQLWHICWFCVCRWWADRSFILFEKEFSCEHWTGAKIDAEPIADGIWMFIGRTAWSLPLLIFSWISIFIPIAAALNVLFMVELLHLRKHKVGILVREWRQKF